MKWWVVLLPAIVILNPATAQDGRPNTGPPALEDFETDADSDGVPDGWYNLRDAKVVDGGIVGPKCLRFTNERPGRQARASRAFAVDGRRTEALEVGIWVKVDGMSTGERLGEDASLQMDFLGEGLVATGRGVLGPWTDALGKGWVRVGKRIPVPPGARDVIMTTGLLGAIGTLEIDGLTIEPIPVGGIATTNLVPNGSLERGDTEALDWRFGDNALRVSPGKSSGACLLLNGAHAAASVDLGVPGTRLGEVQIEMDVQAVGLRPSGGARAMMLLTDAMGATLPGYGEGIPLFRWSNAFDWTRLKTTARVPPGAARVAILFETANIRGTVKIDNVVVTASPDPEAAQWIPDHVETDTQGWKPLATADTIVKGSALDASALLPNPPAANGPVIAKGGHLEYEKGGRARFFGVVVLPPLAFPKADRAVEMADHLARLGVNLVRFSGFDSPLGPGQSLYDDGLDDTLSFDPDAIARFDHLVAELKKRGISIALELLSNRRFREGDKVPDWITLPLGGGAAAAFDPTIAKLTIESGRKLLNHVNPETGLALKDDPVLVWITIAGEHSVFDRGNLADANEASLRRLETAGGRRSAATIEADQWKTIAKWLRDAGWSRPIAGSSHWRRDPEFLSAQKKTGLDLIDDRLYWMPRPEVASEYRSQVWRLHGDLAADVARKKERDLPYAVGEWCNRTDGDWALPYEGADLFFVTRLATLDDWDALCRRGLFLYPQTWGTAPPGSGGKQDLFPIPEAINANPQVFALMPHAASLYLRGAQELSQTKKMREMTWDGAHGRLLIDTPFTQGIAGWSARKTQNLAAIRVDVDNPYAVVMVSSFGKNPIATSDRVLVTAVSRAEPTGLRYADSSKNRVAYAGGAPMLVEPVRGRVVWKRTGKIKAFALGPDGSRKAPAPLTPAADGVTLELDGKSSTLHWELVFEPG